MAVDKFPIQSGHIMMFARSVGDANEIYYDEEYAKTTEPGAIIAPPTFVQSSAQFDPNYFLRPKIGEEWFGSAKGPTGIGLFSCSKATNEVNFAAQKFARAVLGSNYIDSCNRT